MANKELSLVIPVYNEEAQIKEFYFELKNILDNCGKSYEIIFVDDCSTDSSFKILKNIFESDPCVQVISLLGNQGQTIALKAGFKAARGKVVIAMDGDGQHDPKYIPQFLTEIEEGHDIVSGWKVKDAGSSKLKFILSRFAHEKIIAKITGVKMNYFGATMKAYRKEVLQSLDLSGDLHRFMGALVYYKGIKLKEIPIEIRARKSGRSSYRLSKVLRVILDLILIKFLIRHSKAPFVVFGSLGVLMTILGSAGVFYVYVLKYFFGQSAAQNIAGLVISAICFIIGVQFIFFGLMAELVSRVYYTSNNKDFFNIRFHLKHD
jgi:glycosyltransferase involved in cell wall biosynthesis